MREGRKEEEREREREGGEERERERERERRLRDLKVAYRDSVRFKPYNYHPTQEIPGKFEFEQMR